MKKISSFVDKPVSACMSESLAEASINRKYKDSLFTKIFRDEEILADLYNDLHVGEPPVTKDDISIVTLDNALLNDYYNDLAFTVNNRLMVFA